MIPSELLHKIRRFHFKTMKLSKELFVGRYRSAFKGTGIEFSEVREYEYGDDHRSIDWNVSARFGKPHVKVFQEERETTVILVVDVSGSQTFGTRRKLKKELLIEVAGILAFVAARANDRVGMILYSSIIERFIPPRRGQSHIWLLIRQLLAFTPSNQMTSTKNALIFLNKIFRRRSVVFLISDFLDEGYYNELKLCAKRHDLTLIEISDPREHTLPDVGLINVRDPESGATSVIDTRNPSFRKKFSREVLKGKEVLRGIARAEGIRLVEISTDGSVIKPLVELFCKRTMVR